MMLREELERLASAADRFPDPDRVIAGARRRRTHRTGGALVAAAIAVALVVAAPAWWRTRSANVPAQGQGTTVTVVVDWPGSQVPDRDAVNELLAILANRGRALGLAVTAVIGSDDRTVRLTVPGRVDDATLAGLVSPGDLRIRTVTSEVTDTTGTPRSGTGPDANGTAGSGTGPDAEPVTLGTVKAKLGSAYQVAAAIQDPSQVDAGTLERLAPFGALSPAEVAVLPATMQYAVPLVGCAQLDARPPVASGASGQPAAACGGGRMKYLLGPAEVGGTDVRAADAVADPIAGWGVDLQFTGVGSGRWTALTQHAVNGDAVTGGSHAIAFVVDGRVVSAPVVQEVIVGDALISGQLSRAGARLLAAELQYGPLPAFLRILSVSRH